MGGLGSGRGLLHDAKTAAEDCTVLSADELTRSKLLRSAHWKSGSLAWQDSFTGEEVSSVGYELNTHDPQKPWLRLHYTHTRTGEELDYKLGLTYTTTPWSARRWFFLCPPMANDRPCGRRVGKLYLPPGARYFGCRHCYELTYTSCQENHKLDSMFNLLAKDTGMDPKTVKRLLREDWD
jgi:hypothetical protein